jgi:hypothetical protein
MYFMRKYVQGTVLSGIGWDWERRGREELEKYKCKQRNEYIWAVVNCQNVGEVQV